MNSKEYWDNAAGNKKFTVPPDLSLLKRLIRTDAVILDFGCGYGRILGELKKSGCLNLYGSDISGKMIEEASREFPDAVFKVNDGTEIPFADSFFDCVILFAVLTCLPEDAAQEKLLSEISRVLKPEGILYIGDFMINTDERNCRRYENTLKRNLPFPYGVFEVENNVFLRHHSREWLEELTCPFREIMFRESVFTTMNGNESAGFYYIGEKIRISHKLQ